MKRSLRGLGLAVALALVSSAPFAGPPARAHSDVDVGPYEFVIGWRVEPPAVGVLNGLDLGISWHANGTAVLSAHQDLTATVTKGARSTSPPLRPQFEMPGWYTFDLIPTEPGDYSVRIRGNLDGTAVDFTVPIEEVSPASEIEFPAANPTPGDLQGQVIALQGQLTILLAVASLGVILAAASTAAAVMMGRRLRKGP